jgi:hypothetical protein
VCGRFVWNATTLRAMMDMTIATELYSHGNDLGDDFDSSELINVVNLAANAPVVKEMASMVRAGWRQQRPPHARPMEIDLAP